MQNMSVSIQLPLETQYFLISTPIRLDFALGVTASMDLASHFSWEILYRFFTFVLSGTWAHVQSWQKQFHKTEKSEEKKEEKHLKVESEQEYYCEASVFQGVD